MFRLELVSNNRPSTDSVDVAPQKSLLHRKVVSFFAIIAMMVAATIGSAVPSQAAVSPSYSVPAAVSTIVTPGASLCVAAINGSVAKVYVAAFALGYCPTFIILNTRWGQSAVNWAINAYCGVPWLVRLASGGRYSRC